MLFDKLSSRIITRSQRGLNLVSLSQNELLEELLDRKVAALV
jgi:hypothetical protein